MIKFDFKSYMKLDESIFNTYEDKLKSISEILKKKENMLDWYDFDTTVTSEELSKIKEYADFIKGHYDVMIVVGIGGSYLGAKAMIDMFKPYFKNTKVEIIYAGCDLSSSYLVELLDYIKDKNVCVNVISKSGTTLEPSIAFDLILSSLKERYDDISDRLFITTDSKTGLLRKFADENNYKTLVVPDNIGGRYSCMTAVGLLPMAVSGIDIDKLIEGYKNGKALEDDAYRYAVIRDIMYNQDKVVEAYTVYEPKLYYFTEWLKQLFAETQGKEGKGILPISIVNSRDLHSLGQYLQEGKKMIFETVIGIENSIDINTNYKYSLNEINNKALENVCLAHNNGGSNSLIIKMDKLTEENIGSLIYFFFVSAAVGGYLLDINPFDQPGVQEYKSLLHKSLEE